MTLTIDTSIAQEVTVGLTDNDQTVRSLKRENSYGSQITVPLIADIVSDNEVHAIRQITVNEGPGSYTGIRVGISIANALGYLLEVPVNGKKLVEPVYDETEAGK